MSNRAARPTRRTSHRHPRMKMGSTPFCLGGVPPKTHLTRPGAATQAFRFDRSALRKASTSCCAAWPRSTNPATVTVDEQPTRSDRKPRSRRRRSEETARQHRRLAVVGLCDRALIALLVYTFARVSAALHMNVEDYYPQGKRWWVRLHEKVGNPGRASFVSIRAAAVGLTEQARGAARPIVA